jgi:hypothetical protein
LFGRQIYERLALVQLGKVAPTRRFAISF